MARRVVVVGIRHRAAIRRTCRPYAALIGLQARNIGFDEGSIQTMAPGQIVIEPCAELIALIFSRRVAEWQRIVEREPWRKWLVVLLVESDDLSRDVADASLRNDVSGKSISRLRINNRSLVDGLTGAIGPKHDGFVEQRAEITI